MDRLKTGIKNLDGILSGGIPVYSLNIVSGSPGSGKTIFVQNIIFNSARNGLKSLYLSVLHNYLISEKKQLFRPKTS